MPDTGTDTALLCVEVGCEELPAWACDQVASQLGDLLRDALERERLATGDTDPRILVGPRRFAAQAIVRTAQPAERIERRGPTVAAAYEQDGTPTRAAEGFARSQGLAVDELEVREEDGREFLYAVREADQRSLAEVLPQVMETVVGRLSFGKLMRWGTGTARFVRPVRWVTARLGSEPLELEVLGVASGTSTRTHRFLGEVREAELPSAEAYVDVLRGAHVIADQAERRALIEAGLAEHAAAAGGTWTDPGGVLDEVVHLVEWPTVITGRFDERYLQLPERVLITAMQSHQRYFPVYAADGSLLPAFLTVSNGNPEAADTIRAGNERVLAGRLDDAVFSVERDGQRGLADMADGLGDVVFHARAGSLAQRAARITTLARHLGAALGTDAGRTEAAALLCKADLVSTLVQEFAELQGYAGATYARGEGRPDDVVAAIGQHYRPGGLGGELPDAGIPAVVALADKLDLIATILAIGEVPTGSRDPHGLRRAAIGVMRTIVEHDLPVDLDAAIATAMDAVRADGFGEDHGAVAASMRSFIDDRLEKQLTGEGVRIDAIRAARATHHPTLQGLAGLARTLHEAAAGGDERLVTVVEAVRRCTRIIEQAGQDAHGLTVDAALFEAPSEGALRTAAEVAAGTVAETTAAGRFTAALDAARGLAEPIEAFFDRERGVMVMADDPAVRANRLALLGVVLHALAPLGDLGQLQLEASPAD